MIFSQQDTVPEQPRDPSFPRGILKRYHEHEEELPVPVDLANGATIGFTEHRNKRQQTLPLRTSPSAQKWQLPTASTPETSHIQPAAITPPSSYNESTPHLHVDSQHFPDTPSAADAVDMDMDMAMDEAEHPACGGPCLPGQHLEPGPLQPDHIESTLASRVPTPLQPSFAAQVRGNNWGGAAGNIMQSGMAAAPISHAALENGQDCTMPRSLDHPAVLGEWNMVQNRSLPSPISEHGGEDVASPDMVLDSTALHGSSIGRSHSAMGFTPDGCGPYGVPMSTPMRPSVSEAPSPLQTASSPAMETDLATTPSPKKGHTRSRHTIVAWTQQPGMKKSFSIGYRADCEKCRNRVPGHFNHIIVS